MSTKLTVAFGNLVANKKQPYLHMAVFLK